jgi:hypothetical protein
MEQGIKEATMKIDLIVTVEPHEIVGNENTLTDLECILDDLLDDFIDGIDLLENLKVTTSVDWVQP